MKNDTSAELLDVLETLFTLVEDHISEELASRVRAVLDRVESERYKNLTAQHKAKISRGMRKHWNP